MTAAQLTLADVIACHARHRTNRLALSDDTHSVSYRQLWERSQSFGRGLRGLGVRPGDIVAVAAGPTCDTVALLIGSMAAGVVPAPVNTRLTTPEITEYLGKIGAQFLVSDDAGSVGVTTPDTIVLPSFEEIVASAGRPDAFAPTREASPAIAFPTGGTTGLPKAALWSHRGLRLALSSSCENLRVTSSAVEAYISPFFHVTLVTGLLTTLYAGGQVRLSHNPGRLLHHSLTGGDANRIFATPTVLERFMASSPGPHPNMDGAIIFGAAPSDTGFLARLSETFPSADLFSGYGATEFGAVVRLYPEDLSSVDHVGVGRPVPGVEVVIVDPEHGAESAPGATGEICVRSPWQMLGYLGEDPPEVYETTTGARFIRSGDVGSFGGDGYLHLAGRLKETIKTGGETVYPLEVEQVLQRHPDVRHAAVVGMPDSEWGERVEAVVITTGTAVDEQALREYCRQSLAGYKVPKRIHEVDSLPYTPNMKLDRRTLTRQLVEQEATRNA